MATRETVRVMTDGQKSDLLATMAGAIPPLTFDEAQGIIGAKGPFVADVRSAFERAKARLVGAPTPQPTYPMIAAVFELTLDGDDSKNQPLAMVRRDGYSGNWKHKGPVVKGQHTRRFKLVQVGYCRNLDEVRQKLVAHGEIPEGQWREAFKAAYPTPDGAGPVGIADPSWLDSDGGADFPYVYSDGSSYFHWADDGRIERWRWLVAVGK